jgi:hypothetical protein
MAISSANYGGGNTGANLDFSPILAGFAEYGRRQEQERVRRVNELNEFVQPWIERYGPQGIATLAEFGVPMAKDWAEANAIDLGEIKKLPWTQQQRLNFGTDFGEINPQQPQQQQGQQQAPPPTEVGGTGTEQATQPTHPSDSARNPFAGVGGTVEQQPAQEGEATQPVQTAWAGPAGMPEGIRERLNQYSEQAQAWDENYDSYPSSEERDRAIVRYILANPHAGSGNAHQAVKTEDQQAVKAWIDNVDRSQAYSALQQAGVSSSMQLPSDAAGTPAGDPQVALNLPESANREGINLLATSVHNVGNEYQGKPVEAARYVNGLLREELGVNVDAAYGSMRTGRVTLPDPDSDDENATIEVRLPILDPTDPEIQKYTEQMAAAWGVESMTPMQAEMFRQTLIQRVLDGEGLVDENGQINWIEEALEPRYVPGYGIANNLLGNIPIEAADQQYVDQWLNSVKTMEEAFGEGSFTGQQPADPTRTTVSDSGREQTTAGQQPPDDLVSRSAARRPAGATGQPVPTERTEQPTGPTGFSVEQSGTGTLTLRFGEGRDLNRRQRRALVKTKAAIGDMVTAGQGAVATVRDRITNWRENRRRNQNELGYDSTDSALTDYANRIVEEAMNVIRTDPQQAAMLFPETVQDIDTSRRRRAEASIRELEARRGDPTTAEGQLYQQTLDLKFQQLEVDRERLGLTSQQLGYAKNALEKTIQLEEMKLALDMLKTQYQVENFEQIQAAAANDARIARLIETQKLTQGNWRILFDAAENLNDLSYEDAIATSELLNTYSRDAGLGLTFTPQELGVVAQMRRNWFGHNPSGVGIQIQGADGNYTDLGNLDGGAESDSGEVDTGTYFGGTQ